MTRTHPLVGAASRRDGTTARRRIAAGCRSHGDAIRDLDTACGVGEAPLDELMCRAAALRDRGFGTVVTYSRKVFIPVTELCRDVCHYCTFAKTPKRLDAPYLSPDRILGIAAAGRERGCREALFTLGDRPERRYRAARDALAELGYESTPEYVAAMAERVRAETGLLPHINAGVLTADELAAARRVAPSIGLMLESSAARLSERGGPHFGSPDKEPAARLECLATAGRLRVPTTSGVLVGIGETRRERLQSFLDLRELHEAHGHLQEIIVQNFVPKPGTRMRDAAPPCGDEFLWSVAMARLVFGERMSIQAPPNLNPERLADLVAAGINDWGGVSPVTPDHVNPESPWPHLDELARRTAAAGKTLTERLTVYPAYVRDREGWVDARVAPAVLRAADSDGYARDDVWHAGEAGAPARLPAGPPGAVGARLDALPARAAAGETLAVDDVVHLFRARGGEFREVCRAADALRRTVNGDVVSYVVTRNVNYTNVCTYKCRFCAFSKGKTSEDLRGAPYVLDLDEIARRTEEAWHRGATEVCMQGGIHPRFTGDTYLAILRAAKEAAPDIHVHAFSPLEVTHGAATLGVPVVDFLRRLKAAGLATLPGTAAEILDDRVRATLCPDKIDTATWLAVVEAAHSVGLETTSTIMFGHLEDPGSWARHLLALRALQRRSGGITELVPLPFVHMEAPMYRRGLARPGPTLREALLMHAVARLVLHPYIRNIQASWTKLGVDGAALALEAGANDLGGTLMNESISRAAGAAHGQELSPENMEALIERLGRTPRQRNTDYTPVSAERALASRGAAPLAIPVDRPARQYRGEY